MVGTFVHQLRAYLDLKDAISELYSSTESEDQEKFYTLTVLMDRFLEMLVDDFEQDYEAFENARKAKKPVIEQEKEEAD